MTTLYISEYAGLANTGFDGQVAVPAEDMHLTDQKVVVPALAGPANVSAAFQSAPARGPAPMAQPPQGGGTKWVLLTTDTACYIAFGTAPVAAATNRFLQPNIPTLCRVPENQSWAVSCLGIA
jgi:hypothetical protein